MTRRAPLIYLVACEPSADALGAQLMEALRVETEGRARFMGIGGARMTAAGLQSLFDPRELVLLGIFEVVPAYRRVLARVREAIDDITARNPDLLVTIDSWGFTGRIHERLAKAGNLIPRVRYVAPQVWAWRPGRAKQLSRWINHLLTLFPFEPPYFTPHGLATTWVGHPVVESASGRGDAGAFRMRHQIAPEATILSVLPGSRPGEVKRLLPVFRRTVELLAKQHSGLTTVIPTVGTVAELVRDGTSDWPCPLVIVNETEVYDAFAASRAALAASGTVSLELAMASVPHVIAYRVSALSAFVFRRLRKTRFANLVNVLLDRLAVPELLQEDCNPKSLAAAISQILLPGTVAETQRADFKEALAKLVPPDGSPSRLAARTVLKLIRV